MSTTPPTPLGRYGRALTEPAPSPRKVAEAAAAHEAKAKPTPHPAKMTDTIIEALRSLIPAHYEMMTADTQAHLERGGRLRGYIPFAGTGKDHAVAEGLPIDTVGVELEPEWAHQHQRTVVGDCLTWQPGRGHGLFDLTWFSPTYGNRFADHHNAKDESTRFGYKFQLGRMPGGTGAITGESSAVYHWGPRYRGFHDRFYQHLIAHVLAPGALIFCNTSNFLKLGVEKKVVEYHVNAMSMLGCYIETVAPVPTPRMGFGAGGENRVSHERIIVMRTPVTNQAQLL